MYGNKRQKVRNRKTEKKWTKSKKWRGGVEGNRRKVKNGRERKVGMKVKRKEKKEQNVGKRRKVRNRKAEMKEIDEK